MKEVDKNKNNLPRDKVQQKEEKKLKQILMILFTLCITFHFLIQKVNFQINLLSLILEACFISSKVNHKAMITVF